jgi:hypothetical protein
MDFLPAEARAVEEAVFFHTADRLNLAVDLVFYDTTTASFSVDEEDEASDELETGLRPWGKPKEGGWAVPVVVALAVTRKGLAVRCWVFPGKTTDVQADLRGWKLRRALLVADAGMSSRENRAELGRACGKYLRPRLAHRACGGVGLLAILVPYPTHIGGSSGDGISLAHADCFSNKRGPATRAAGLQIPRNPATQAGSRHYRTPQRTLRRVATRRIF